MPIHLQPGLEETVVGASRIKRLCEVTQGRRRPLRIALATVPMSKVQFQHDFVRSRPRVFQWLEFLGVPPSLPSLSLLCLAPMLIEDGHEVVYIEGGSRKYDELLSELHRLQPDMIGLTVISAEWRQARSLLADARRELPDTIIVIGGCHPTQAGRRCLEESEDVDIAVMGDGELALREIAAAVQQGGPLADIEGIYYRDGDEIVGTGPRENNHDLDSLPFPAYELVDLRQYRPSPTHYRRLPAAGIMASRGCPYRCTFCYSSPVLRVRSPGNVVDEIETLVREHGVRDITFWDDTFTMSTPWGMAVCDELIRRDLRIGFNAFARADCINEPLLRRMREAGCYMLLYGIESGVQKNLDKLKKDQTLEEIRHAVQMAHAAGIQVYGSFVFGIPGESYDEGLQTIAFARELDVDHAIFLALTPLPGTELHEEVLAGRMRPAKGGSPPYSFKGLSSVPEGMTEEEILALIRLGLRRVYLRPRMVARKLREVRRPADIVRFAQGFLLVAGSRFGGEH